MKTSSLERRSIFVIREDDQRKINEAKFKLAECGYGYGRLADKHYWSIPTSRSDEGFAILQSIFVQVQRFG